MWVWLSDPRTTWFRCLYPCEPYEHVPWENCQYYCHRCTHCLEVDRAQKPFHRFPCCSVYGRRREANGPAMTLTQVACQVTRLRPGYAFLTGKSFFFHFLIDVDPLRSLRGGPHRWVSPSRLVPKASMWVVINSLSASRTDTVHLSLRHLFFCHVHRSCVLNSAMPIMGGRPHYTIGNGTAPGRCVLVRKAVQ